jgi:predicted CoA-binding protein
LGKDVYSTLLDYDKKIDIAIFVLPPKIGIKILEDVKNLKIKTVWFQPGAESEDNIKFCTENNISYIANSCIMIQSNK